MADADSISDILALTPQFSRNLPPAPEPEVDRRNFVETIAEVATADSPVVFIEGDEGSGATTLLAQFARLYPNTTFSLFIRPASRFAYGPDYLRLVLAEQYWWHLTGTRLEEQFVDIADFAALQLKVRKSAKRSPVFITVDGLHQIPNDPRAVEQILREVLPIGVDGFRFLIAGSQASMEASLPGIRTKTYRLAKFSEPEAEILLADTGLSSGEQQELVKLCQGNPGRLSSVRRLLTGGTSAQAILDSAPDKYLNFIGLEFKPIYDLSPIQKTLLATLAFARHSIGREELLSIVSSAQDEDVDILTQRLSFLSEDPQTRGINFLSEAHRRFAEKTLLPHKQEALNLQIEHLVRDPNSATAIRLLPTYYQSLNRLQAIVDLISRDHYQRLLEVTSSVAALRARAAIGARSALELNQARSIFQFSLQRSIFSAIANPDQLQSEVSALVALGKPGLALDIAAKTATNESRISLLAEFARQSKERGLGVDTQVVTYIQELAEGIDFAELGEAAVELAENIMFVDPDLALRIVDIALKPDANASARDEALAKMTLAATFSKDPDKGELDKKTNARISDASLQKIIQSVCTIAADYSFEEIVRTVETMEIGHKIYFLRTIVAAGSGRANVFEVVEFALDLLVRNTTYTPKAKDLAEFALPLTVSECDEVRVRHLIKRIEAQIGLLENSSPSVDLTLLQLRLAHAEYRFDHRRAIQRLDETYYAAAALESKEVQAACFATMAKAIDVMEKASGSDALSDLKSVVLQDLKDTVSSLLADTASHFQVAHQTLVSLTASSPDDAIDFAGRMNIEERRDRAFNAIAETLAALEYSEVRNRALNTCLSRLSSPTKVDQTILSVLGELARSRHFKGWIAQAERLAMRTSTPGATCAAEVLLVQLLERSGDSPIIAARVGRFESNIALVDSLFERVDLHFMMASAIAQALPDKAAEVYEKGASERSSSTVASDSGAAVLVACLHLLIRCMRPLFSKSAMPDDHLVRFARICEKIPCSKTKTQIYTEMACRAWSEGRIELCSEILNTYCRPMLEDSERSNSSLHGELCSIVFPALHCVHSPSAYAILERAPASSRSAMIFNTALLILRKSSPAEPWSALDDEGIKTDYPSLLDVCALLKHTPTDSLFYSVTQLAVRTAVHKVNRTQLTGQQKTDFHTRISELIAEKLPNTATGISHNGFVIICTAQAMRLIETNQQVWEKLASDARDIPNIADQSFILLELVDCIPNRFGTLRLSLLEEARSLARQIPAAFDRYSHLESYIRIAKKLDPSGAKSALKEAMLLTFEMPQRDASYKSRRSLVDIAASISPGVLDELAEMIDDDPARAAAKIDLKRSVEVHKFRKELSSLTAVEKSSNAQRRTLPSAAWKNVEALKADRIAPKKPEMMSGIVDAAGAFSLNEAYPVLAWYIENAAKRYTTRDDVATFFEPLSEVLLHSTELAASLISEAPEPGRLAQQAREVGASAKSSLVVRPGQRALALERIARWLRDNASEAVLLCDPYYSQLDTDFLRLVLTNSPNCRVRVLTTKKAVTEKGRIFETESFLAEWNDLVEQEPPPTEIIALSGIESATGPIHDRWLLTANSGLRLGTSFNSLGIHKLTEVSSLSAEELQSLWDQLEPYLNRQRLISGKRITYQVVSF